MVPYVGAFSIAGTVILLISYVTAVTSHPIQAEDDGDMERSRVLILPVFKGEGGLPNVGIESINSSCEWNLSTLQIELVTLVTYVIG